jgi:hypothetical protein
MTDTQSMSSPLPIKRVSVAGGASRMGIGGFLRSTQQERSDLFDRFAKG